MMVEGLYVRGNARQRHFMGLFVMKHSVVSWLGYVEHYAWP